MATVRETFSGEIKEAHGKELKDLQFKDGFTRLSVIPYDGGFNKFPGMDDVRAAGEYPKDSELLTMINNKVKAVAVAKARAEAIEAAGVVKPDIKNDGQLRLAKMYDIFRANGSTHDEARAEAASALKLTWED